MKDKRSYARCKACDRQFYPQWRQDINCFEDLCHKCLPVAIAAANNWDEEESVTELVEISEIPDSLWAEDEYLAHGEIGGFNFLEEV